MSRMGLLEWEGFWRFFFGGVRVERERCNRKMFSIIAQAAREDALMTRRACLWAQDGRWMVKR
jgi:hypothetical protein